MDMGKYSYADNINIGEGQGGMFGAGERSIEDDCPNNWWEKCFTNSMQPSITQPQRSAPA